MIRILARRFALGAVLALAASPGLATPPANQIPQVPGPNGLVYATPGATWVVTCNNGSGGFVGVIQTSGPGIGTACQLPGSGGSQTVTWPLGATTPVNPVVMTVQIDPTTGYPINPNTAVPVTATGPTAAGASYTANPLPGGCRAQGSVPAPNTDGSATATACSLKGKTLVAPADPSLYVWGSASTTGNTAQAFTGISAPGTGVSVFATSIQCFRTDTGPTLIYVTLNDSASTPIAIPAGSGNDPTFPVPLKFPSATQPTFTPSAATTSVFCSLQGFQG